VIAGKQAPGFRLALEFKDGGAPQHHHPLALRLIVPESGGRTLAARDDALDPHSRRHQQVLENLLRYDIRNIIEDIGFKRTHTFDLSN
jgi:hypothetical protein